MKAVVYEDARRLAARDVEDATLEDPTDVVVRVSSSAICGTAQVISDLARLVNPTGHVAIAGVYAEKDLHPAPEESADGALRVPWATFFNKGMSVNFGRTHDRRYTTRLRDLVVAGRARPGRIVTHHGGLAEAPALYDKFDRRAEGVVKAVLRPN